MVSVNSFESSSIHNEVRWVNYGPIYGKIDYKVGHVWGRGYLVIDKAPPSACLSQIKSENPPQLRAAGNLHSF